MGNEIFELKKLNEELRNTNHSLRLKIDEREIKKNPQNKNLNILEMELEEARADNEFLRL